MNEIANNLFVLAYDVIVNTNPVFHVIHLFNETGSVNPPCMCSKEKRPQTEEAEMREIMVRNMITENDTLSTGDLSKKKQKLIPEDQKCIEYLKRVVSSLSKLKGHKRFSRLTMVGE